MSSGFNADTSDALARQLVMFAQYGPGPDTLRNHIGLRVGHRHHSIVDSVQRLPRRGSVRYLYNSVSLRVVRGRVAESWKR
jgi:hypothetical protein